MGVKVFVSKLLIEALVDLNIHHAHSFGMVLLQNVLSHDCCDLCDRAPEKNEKTKKLTIVEIFITLL